MLPDDFLTDAAAIAPVLLDWFAQYMRDLPWRRTRDPYAIWVSEIMLQQTRVAAVLDHYARWMERFPTVVVLAAADEAGVLALWSGLGYYRRARMLHRAAQIVASEHGGVLPRTAAELTRLPGIGDYTSAAIASIAFGEAVAVVDGNVERVVTRLACLAPKEPSQQGSKKQQSGPSLVPPPRAALARAIRSGANALLVPGHAGNSNQALMELGATICLPKAPLCLQCPAQPWCRTRGEHASTPRTPPVVRNIAYALIEHAGRLLLEERPHDASLMAGMWELPQVAHPPEGAEVLMNLRHAITVTSYAVTIVRLPPENAEPDTHQRWTQLDKLPTLPLTGLARKVLKRVGLWPAS